MHYRHRLHRTNAIDLFEAILTELKIAGPKDARQVDIHLLRSFGGPTAAIPDAGREREIPAREPEISRSYVLSLSPWDMAVSEKGGDGNHNDQLGEGDDGNDATLFVTNVLNGTVAGGGQIVNEGTVVRIGLTVSAGSPPSVKSLTVIGSEFSERTDPAALVIGPTGMALGKNKKTLYVADSLNNRITAIADPLTRHSSDYTGSTLSSGGCLNDPLGLTLAVNGNILTTNGNDGYLVETTAKGVQKSKTLLDNTGNPPGGGTLFGLVDVPGLGVYFVDDGSNTLNLFH
jgi:hypothetical protein